MRQILRRLNMNDSVGFGSDGGEVGIFQFCLFSAQTGIAQPGNRLRFYQAFCRGVKRLGHRLLLYGDYTLSKSSRPLYGKGYSGRLDLAIKSERLADQGDAASERQA